MKALTALKERRSVRQYERREVPRELVEQVIDCGRLAASANNAQPWLFIAVSSQETRWQIASLTDYGKFIAEAPVCVAVFCEKANKYYLEDGSAATQNILVAATALGLGSCWVAGDKKAYAKAVRELLGVPESYTLISLVALGFPRGPAPSVGKRPLGAVMRWERY